MALVLKDRVKETTTTTGTGAITLAGAVSNFQTFTSVLSNADTTYYAIIDDTNGAFEVGLGTFASSGTTLTRTTILESSNSGSAVNLGTGTKQVFMTYPAEKSVFLNGSNQLVINGSAVTSSVTELNILTGKSFVDEDGMDSNSATAIASQQSIKAYVDAQLTAQDLDIQGDSGGALSIDLDSETLTITGGTGISTSGLGNVITINGDDASTSGKGIASFSSDDFSVSSGAVTIKSGGITNTQLAGSIANSKLSNSSVSFGGVSVALGASDATPAFDLSDATNYPTSSLSGTITNAQLAGSIANSKLANSSITVSDGSNTTATALGGTITFSGTSNEVDVAESSGTITIGLPNNVTIAGNLTVNGTTTTVNSTTVTIDDPIFTLGGDSAPGSDDNKDRGIEFRYHDGSSARIGFFGYDDSNTAFTLFTEATNSSEVFSGTVGNAIFNEITGTLQTAAQTNITSLGTLSALSISGTTTQTGVSTSAAKDVFNAGMSVKNGSSSAGFIEFFEDSDNGTNKVTLIGPSSTSDVTLTLPSSAGTIATNTSAADEATALAIALG